VSTLRIVLSATETTFQIDDQGCAMPVGPDTLLRELQHDPPWAEELTNAVGWVLDHLEDVEREAPGCMFADRIEVCGGGVDVIAAVEVGHTATLPFELTRDAAEDVYRTMVTESDADRAHNPGLPAEVVHDVLGVACEVVALMRFLRAESVWVVTS
jgi:exopolyphosphatase/guanosine-5'-triphosphate,3'-diphosphate pyrophosphatase